MNLYIPIVGMVVLATVFVAVSMTLSVLIGPGRKNRAKYDSYECGIQPTPQPVGGGRFPVKYYVIAMLFIVFDIEIVFLYPWAVTYHQLGLFGVIAIISFIVTVLVAYFYVKRRTGGPQMGIEEKLPSGILLTTVEGIFGWVRKASFWPVTMGLACCAIEMMAYATPRFDSARWGQEVFRASPRQADLMIVSGRLSQKMAPIVRQVYDQMPNPKWVISMGACASSGGMFNNYAIVQGCDHIVPVDIYVPGCPPRPDMLIDAMFKLRQEVSSRPIGPNEAAAIAAREEAALTAPATHELKGLMR